MQLLFVLFIALFMTGSGGKPTLKASPSQGFAPLKVTLTATIPYDAGNQAACVSWGSEEMVSASSCWTFEAQHQLPTVHRDITLTSGGSYTIEFTVNRGGTWLHATPVRVHVVEEESHE